MIAPYTLLFQLIRHDKKLRAGKYFKKTGKTELELGADKNETKCRQKNYFPERTKL